MGEPVDGVNWDATSHQRLWEWFADPELTELEGWMRSLNDKVVTHFQAAADHVDQALRAAGAQWEGAAADAMLGATTPLAEHALMAKDAAEQAGVTSIGQFMQARNMALALPEPQPAPDQNLLLAALSGDLPQQLVDVAKHEAAANEAEARARDLARSYDASADDAVSSLPRFEPAPTATVTRAEPDVLKVDEPAPDTDQGREATRGQSWVPTGGEPSGPTPPASGPPIDGTRPSASASPVPVTSPGPAGPRDTPTPDRGVTSQGPHGAAPRSARGTTAPGPHGAPSSGPRGGAGPGSAVPRSASPGPHAGGSPGARVPGPESGQRPVGSRGIPLAAETAPAARAGAARGMDGMAPMAPGRKDEDVERTTPEYLRDYHDDFWDDSPPVAPAVIGDEDDG